MGRALVAALRAAGVTVDGPLPRGASGAGADVVILAVPDAQIAAAAACVAPGPLVGHCSGATGLEVLAGHEGFGLHPLMTVTREETSLAGAACAVAGSSPRARRTARALAHTLGMVPVEVADEDRAAYHAAASVASNFLVTLEAFAERLVASAGLERAHLVPLVRATVENWAALGPEGALTGPVARGDDVTVARQRAAVEARTPELVALFDVLVEATRRVGDGPATARSATPAADGTVAA
jgi:predicted short-subunit dehydrogenase-like oxidoreductase (DUF2520 family)